MQHISDLQSRFGKKRKNIFDGKAVTKMISNRIEILRYLNLVIRDNNKYKISPLFPSIISLYANLKILEDHLSRIKDKSSKLQIDAISISGIDIYGLFLL